MARDLVDIRLDRRHLLTPHPAEAARLLKTDTATVQADRLGTARELAKRFRCEVVLKGAGSACAQLEVHRARPRRFFGA